VLPGQTLDHVENIQLNHWYNNTDENQEYSNEYTSQLAVKSGEEVSVSVNLSAEFEGLSVGGGVDQKTFSSIETTKSKTYTLKITVPKNSDLWLYQRRYIFVTKMTWVLNAWAGPYRCSRLCHHEKPVSKRAVGRLAQRDMGGSVCEYYD